MSEKNKNTEKKNSIKSENIAKVDEQTPDIEEVEVLSRLDIESKEKQEIKNGTWMNKHKIPGKHRLKYDSIFKGKKQNLDEADTEPIQNEGFEIDQSSSNWQAKYEFEEYNRLKNLRQQIYNIIIEKTDINLKANRRKPGRIDFNVFYNMLVENLNMQNYSYSEIFLELSYYFSENEYNMFKLLDQKWGTIIVKELSTKYSVNKMDGVDFI